MNNLLSYCGLVDAKIRASDIDLPVTNSNFDNPIEQCGMHYKSGQFQGLHFVTGNPHIIIPYHARLPKLNESRPQNSDKQTVSMEKKWIENIKSRA